MLTKLTVVITSQYMPVSNHAGSNMILIRRKDNSLDPAFKIKDCLFERTILCYRPESAA